MYLGPEYEFTAPTGLIHNTYHGQTRHYRPSLNLSEPAMNSPLRITDSPQHIPPSVASSVGTYTTTQTVQSPRRKSSSASNESNEQTIIAHQTPSHRSTYVDYARQDSYNSPPPNFPPPDYPISTAYHSHYYQEYRGPPQEPYYVERIYPDYQRPDVYHIERIYPDFARHQDGSYAYDNPSSSVSSASGTSANLSQPRTPQRAAYSHRRTASNVSNTSNSSSSNVNPSFKMDDSDALESTSSSLSPRHPATSPPKPPQLPPRRVNSHDSSASDASTDRPVTLEIPPRMRLPKPPKTLSASNGNSSTTPPGDDECGSSASTGTRVRFSPTVKTENGEETQLTKISTLLDVPVEGQSRDVTIPLTAVKSPKLNQVSRRRFQTPSIQELEREFL